MTFRDLLPSHVVVEAAPLPPGADRAAEHAAGRRLALAALARLGRVVEVVGVLPDRSPDWPDGVRGSITHGAGEVAAAVTAAGPEGLGIDVERRGPLPQEVVDLACSRAEQAACAFLGDDGPAVVFSAKESVFKAWAPTRGWLEHDDVDVDVRRDGTFVATVAGTRMPGRWEVDARVVRTCADLQGRGSRRRPEG